MTKDLGDVRNRKNYYIYLLKINLFMLKTFKFKIASLNSTYFLFLYFINKCTNTLLNGHKNCFVAYRHREKSLTRSLINSYIEIMINDHFRNHALLNAIG